MPKRRRTNLSSSSRDTRRKREARGKAEARSQDEREARISTSQLERHTASLQSGSSLLEPFVCYHCGDRSDDRDALEEHIRREHKGDPSNNNEEENPDHGEEEEESYVEEVDDDGDPVPPMLLEDLVEVQIKEEPDFLVPLDLSRKDNLPVDNHIWIKQEPDSDDNYLSDTVEPEEQLPKIRVASESVLKAPAPAPPLLVHNLLDHQPGPPPLYPFGNFADKLLSVRLLTGDSIRFRAIRPLPPLIALPRTPGSVPRHFFPQPTFIALPRPRLSAVPRERMPNSFPQTPYLLKVPYSCYHCGGRSGDLDTLKTHIETMHNPESLHRQRLEAQAKIKILQSIAENRIVDIKIPRPPKLPRPPKVKLVKEKPLKEKKVIIKIPKPFKLKEVREKIQSQKKMKLENCRFKCPFCPFGGNSFRGLILHASVKHEQDRAQKRLAAEEEKLQELLKEDPTASTSKSKKNYFYCLFCDYKSLQKPQLKKHMYAIHGKEKAHQCPYCNHKTAYGENMRWHMLKHKLRCPHCRFMSTSRANLLEHQKRFCPDWIDGGIPFSNSSEKVVPAPGAESVESQSIIVKDEVEEPHDGQSEEPPSGSQSDEPESNSQPDEPQINGQSVFVKEEPLTTQSHTINVKRESDELSQKRQRDLSSPHEYCESPTEDIASSIEENSDASLSNECNIVSAKSVEHSVSNVSHSEATLETEKSCKVSLDMDIS